MDAEDLLALLDGEEDVLTPKFQQIFVKAANSSCPKCGDRMEAASNGTELFKDAVALAYRTRCVGCGLEATPSGILL